MQKDFVDVDGSFSEGGGQVVRTAVALSAVTGKPCRIFNIRKGRPQPGLKHQHLEAVRAVANLCGAEAKSLSLGSTELEFFPGKIKSGDVSVHIPTAGSIGLVLQAMMIPAMHADGPVKIKFEGGATNGKWAPPVNYLRDVVLPLLKKMNYQASMDVRRYGYYPVGGAAVSVEIVAKKLVPLNLVDRGKLLCIKGISHASKHLEKPEVAERQKRSAVKELSPKLGVPLQIEVVYTDAACPGSGIELEAVFENSVLGASALGEKTKAAEAVGKEAALSVLEQISSGAAVDEHAEDQLLPYMALAPPSSITAPKITSHTKTNIWVIEKFLPVKFSVEGGVISVDTVS